MSKPSITVPVAIALILFSLPASVPVFGQERLSGAEVAEAVGRATVTLRCARQDGATSSGSGFNVEASGLVVTNHHVVQGCKRVQVKFSSGDVFDVVDVHALDATKDLAIVRVPGFNLPTVELGDSDTVKRGDDLLVIGNPLGILEGSVSRGVLSGIRDVEGARLFQMDAAVNPGNSGGPVVNAKGEVIGVTRSKITEAEGLNFAIPINYVRGLLAYDQDLELASLLGNGDGSLFGNDGEDSVTGTWRSLSPDALTRLTQDGDFVSGLGEAWYTEDMKTTYVYDLRWQPDGSLAGTESWRDLPCGYYTTLGESRLVRCNGEVSVSFRVVTTDRLEGEATYVFPLSRGTRDWRSYCKSRCQQGESKVHKFVWVRQD